MMGLAVMLCLAAVRPTLSSPRHSVTLQPSAKLSFPVLGPMLDFKLYAMYTVIFRPKLIMTIYIAVIGQVLVYSVATHYFWENVQDPVGHTSRAGIDRERRRTRRDRRHG
jgi:uncharacterized membrane protein YraQ (UPF0718 family)